MPVPAHRKNKSKVRRTRSHDALKIVQPNLCPKCQTPLFPHRACSVCGFYKGKQVMKSKADILLKRTEKRKKKEQKDKERMEHLKNK